MAGGTNESCVTLIGRSSGLTSNNVITSAHLLFTPGSQDMPNFRRIKLASSCSQFGMLWCLSVVSQQQLPHDSSLSHVYIRTYCCFLVPSRPHAILLQVARGGSTLLSPIQHCTAPKRFTSC